MSPRKTLARYAALVSMLAVFVCLPARAATDVITVGTVTATASSFDVPISIRDVAGTPLGMDQPAGSRIQAFSVRVTFAPASAVETVTIARAGITAGLTPVINDLITSTSNSRSLAVQFAENTNPIPFTLNAPAPGNQIAKLTFKLSSSAVPGTSISLTLDSSLTTLTDAGGTGATKETEGNGRLTLVNGQINVPALTMSLSPGSKSIEVGSLGSLTASFNGAVPSDTVVNLTSSNPDVGTVPASVTVSAGSTSASFKVTALTIGTTKITATSGSLTANSNITVTAPQPSCPKPAPPVLTAPASSLINTAYTVSWAAVTNATDYVLEESTNAEFTSPSTQVLTTTSASFTHANTDGRYYYRVRARNKATSCDVTGDDSAVVSVLMTEIAPPPAPLTRVLTVVGSTAGNFGAFFRTSLQLYNSHDSTVSGKLVFHRAGASGSASDPSLPYTLAPGKTLSYNDLLPAMSLSGLGSVDLVGDVGSPLPIALSRVFNDAGASGTTGLTQQALAAEASLRAGAPGVLLAPPDVAHFRFNVGVRSLEQGAAFDITVRDKDGNVVKTVSKSYGPTFFSQVSSTDFLGGYVLTGGETITLEATSGSAFVYGSTTDNTTNDPSVQFLNPLQ